MKSAGLILCILCGSTVPASAQTIGMVPGSTRPLVQLSGEHFQIFSNGSYFYDLQAAPSMSRAGVLGTDLGTPVVYPDKIVFLFGDSLATYANAEPKYFLAAGSGSDDSMGYIPNGDLAGCNYIQAVDQELKQGNSKPSISPSNCPALEFYKNPSAGPLDHKFKSISISGLAADEGHGPYMTPSGAIDLNGRLYMFYVTKYQDVRPHFALQSILARADQAHTEWSEMKGPTFTKLHTVSSHPFVANPASPPPEANDSGKFMFNSPVAIEAGKLAEFGLNHLPPELRASPKVVFVFGSSWRYDRSNLYLAAFAASDIEAGPAAWFYFTGLSGGVATWSKDEKLTSPLIPGLAAIGNHSVVWNPALKSFILMYGNVVCQFASTPWSTWSDPIWALTPQGEWATKLIHHAGQDPITRSIVPIYNPRTGNRVDLDGDAIGVPYSPYLLDKYTVNGDGSVTVYYAISGWAPYQVWLFSSTFLEGSTAIGSSSRAMPQLAFGGGWSTSLYFYNSNDVPVTVSVRPYNASGVPLAIPDAGPMGARLSIRPKGTAQLPFPNRGALRQGWAEVLLPDGVSGYGVFRQTIAGRFDQEAVVPLTTTNLSSASWVFDDVAGLSSTMAVANPGDSLSNVTHIARDETGRILGTSTVELLPKGRQAIRLRDIFPGVAGRRGSIESRANPGTLAALGLRFNTTAFTSIPGESSTALSPAALPQIAFGGGWYTALQFFNMGDSLALVELSLFDASGQSLNVPSIGGSTATLSIAPKGTAILELPNSGDLQEGWARVSLPGTVTGYGVFRQSSPGRADQEAVVMLTNTTSAVSTLIFDETDSTTAISVVNPRDVPATITLVARGEAGQLLGSAIMELAPNARQAIALRTLLPEVVGQRGSVQLDAGTGAVSLLGLRFSASAVTSIPAQSK